MLTVRGIEAARPRPTPLRLPDGRGLYLLVMPDGAKYWRYDYTFAGTRHTMSLGVWPDVDLKAARTAHDTARRAVLEGRDPHRKTHLSRPPDTYQEVSEEWLAKREKTKAPATQQKIRIISGAHLYPALGPLPIGAIEAPVLLLALQAIEAKGRIETAHRAREIAGQVFRYAVATGRARRDPSADLRGALTPHEHQHHPAVTEPEAIGRLLRLIDGYDGMPSIRLALQLLALTFVRPGELREARWTEFDGAMWRLPSKRTKTRTERLIPLSRQALAVLKELRALTGHSVYLFPNPRTRLRPMSENALNQALRRLGYGQDQLTAHGFRAMARTYLDERLRQRPEIIEVQLGHAVPGLLGATYNRSQWLEERAAMLQTWGDELDRLRGIS